jgi:hypothetical protein
MPYRASGDPLDFASVLPALPQWLATEENRRRGGGPQVLALILQRPGGAPPQNAFCLARCNGDCLKTSLAR